MSHKDITDPEQLREVINKELEPWIKKHHKTPEYQSWLLDLLIKKELDSREPNRIMWTKPDIVDIKAQTEAARSLKEMLEAARQEKKEWLEKILKEQQEDLDRDFVRTTWICYEKPVWCSIGICRNKSKIVLTDDFHFEPSKVHNKYCPTHAKMMHRFHVCSRLPGRTKRERIKMQLRQAEFDKKLRDLGLNV
jgi:hypothetical protein